MGAVAAVASSLATRPTDTLYYHLSDPSGTSLTLAHTDGSLAGRLLYDGYGGVLSSTLSLSLTQALAGNGATPDPATGLAYQGNGRWYEPQLGRPLQPRSVGGVPAVPQGLNRYAVTSVGQVGVFAGVRGGGFLQAVFIATRNQIPGTLAGLIIDQVTITTLEHQTVKRAVPAAWGIIELLHPPTTGWAGLVTGLTQSRLGQGLTRLLGVGGRIAAAYAGRNSRSVVRVLLGSVLEDSFAAGEAVSVGSGASQRLLARGIAYVDDVVTEPVTRGLGRLGTGLSIFSSGVIGGLIQYAYDFNNPYLSGTQKGFRAITSGGLGSGATIIGLGIEYAIVGSIGGPIGIGVAVAFGIGFELWLAPIIFKATGAIDTRNLAPLQE